MSTCRPHARCHNAGDSVSPTACGGDLPQEVARSRLRAGCLNEGWTAIDAVGRSKGAGREEGGRREDGGREERGGEMEEREAGGIKVGLRELEWEEVVRREEGRSE